MKKKVLLVLLALFVVVVGGTLVYLSVGQYEATPRVVSYTEVNGKYHDDYIEFDHQKDKGLIFFTGAKVQPEAYSYLNEVQDANVYIVDAPFNFAMFSSSKAKDIMEEHKDVKSWYVAGHSLGGVVASMFAEDNVDLVDGVVLLASYPAETVESDMPYLSIYATSDGLVGDYSEYKELFKDENTTYVEIEGGNHSQFGNYGFQKGDNKSMTSDIDQQQTVVDSIKEFIK